MVQILVNTAPSHLFMNRVNILNAHLKIRINHGVQLKLIVMETMSVESGEIVIMSVIQVISCNSNNHNNVRPVARSENPGGLLVL